MKPLSFKTPRLAVTAGMLLLAGCDADAGIGGSQNDSSLTLLAHDNPVVWGTALVWSESWRYTDSVPLDDTRPIPATTEERVWADSGPLGLSQAVMEITASHAIFVGKMAQGNPSTAWTLPAGGTPTVFKSSLGASTVPWLHLPPECQNFNSGPSGNNFLTACAAYVHRPSPNQSKPYTFPFVVGDVDLPAGTTVTLNTVTRTHNPNTGGIWGTQTFIRQTATLKTDPSLLVVPVHVHIFTDTQGRTNNTFMGGLVNSTAGRITMATNVREVFDEHAVNVLGIATAATSSSWHREYKTQLTRNLLDVDVGSANDKVFDLMLDDCKVQVRLAEVEYIAQADGLEKAEIGYADVRSTTPNWINPNNNPTDQTIMVQSQKAATYVNAMKNSPGVHVFVVGKINSAGTAANGIGFPTRFGVRGYALMAGLRGVGKQALEHEVGHTLGLTHFNSQTGDTEDITPMFEHALTPAMCTKMRSAAQNALSPTL